MKNFIVETALSKIAVREYQVEEARGALLFAAAVAVDNAVQRLTLEALALELCDLPEPTPAKSPRARRNERRRLRSEWIETAFDPKKKIEKKTNQSRRLEIETALNRDEIAARALGCLAVDSLTTATFDGETGLRIYSRERVAETLAALLDESKRLSTALRRVGAFNA